MESMLKVVSISVERIRPECRHNEMSHLEYLSAVVATLPSRLVKQHASVFKHMHVHIAAHIVVQCMRAHITHTHTHTHQ